MGNYKDKTFKKHTQTKQWKENKIKVNTRNHSSKFQLSLIKLRLPLMFAMLLLNLPLQSVSTVPISLPFVERSMLSLSMNSLRLSATKNLRNSREELLSQLASLSIKFAVITLHAQMIHLLLKLKI